MFIGDYLLLVPIPKQPTMNLRVLFINGGYYIVLFKLLNSRNINLRAPFVHSCILQICAELFFW